MKGERDFLEDINIILRKHNVSKKALCKKVNRGPSAKAKLEIIYLLSSKYHIKQVRIAEYLGIGRSTVSLNLNRYCKKYSLHKPNNSYNWFVSIQELSLSLSSSNATLSRAALEKILIELRNAGYKAGWEARGRRVSCSNRKQGVT